MEDNYESKGLDSRGKFAKGRKKTGGRKKGQPNHNTMEIKEAITEIISDNVETAKEKLNMIPDPKDYLMAYTRLAEFVLPKQSAVKVSDVRQSDLKSELSEMEYNEI